MRQNNSITNTPHLPDEESGQFPSCTSTRHQLEEASSRCCSNGSDPRLALNHGKVKNYYQDAEFFTANTSSGMTNGKNRRSYFFCLSRHSFVRLFVGLSLFMMVFLSISVCLVYLQDTIPNTSSPSISSSYASFVSEEAQGHTPGHLIIVPGHAIYLGHLLNDTAAIIGSGHRDTLKLDEEDEIYLRDGWLLQNSFQLDQTPYYIRHIHRGIELMTQDPQSILMFSGGSSFKLFSPSHLLLLFLLGQTRRLAGPISEAASYTIFSIQRGFLSREQFNERVILEEFARDSYENVLFSVARYFQRFGKHTLLFFPRQSHSKI